MIPNPIKLIFQFTEDRLKRQSDFCLNKEFLQHLISMKNIENSGELLESYVYDYVENKIRKSIDYCNFESIPPNE
jgi:hypothetical protein